MNDLFQKKNLLHIICFIVSLLCTHIIYAQKDFMPSIERITTKQGLFSNDVAQVMQDRKGFIWITLAYGLARYDGNSFRHYFYNPKDSNTIKPGFLPGMKGDSSGTIWIASANQGLYSFDPSTEKFTAFHPLRGISNSLSANDLNGLEIDSKGIIWVGSFAGLNAYDPGTKTFRRFLHRAGDRTTISDNLVAGICRDDENRLWLFYVSVAGADCFDPQTGKVILHLDIDSLFHNNKSQLPEISAVSRGRDGNIWIATAGMGLIQYNSYSKKILRFMHDPADPYSLHSNNIIDALEDPAGNVWIATEGGLDYYERRSEEHTSELQSQR